MNERWDEATPRIMLNTRRRSPLNYVPNPALNEISRIHGISRELNGCYNERIFIRFMSSLFLCFAFFKYMAF